MYVLRPRSSVIREGGRDLGRLYVCFDRSLPRSTSAEVGMYVSLYSDVFPQRLNVSPLQRTQKERKKRVSFNYLFFFIFS